MKYWTWGLQMAPLVTYALVCSSAGFCGHGHASHGGGTHPAASHPAPHPPKAHHGTPKPAPKPVPKPAAKHDSKPAPHDAHKTATAHPKHDHDHDHHHDRDHYHHDHHDHWDHERVDGVVVGSGVATDGTPGVVTAGDGVAAPVAADVAAPVPSGRPQIQFSVDPSEIDSYDAAARAAGMSREEWIRNRLNAAAGREMK